MIAAECIAVLLSPREELFRAADELLSVIPMPQRSALDAETDDLMERRQRLPDLARLSPLHARMVLSIGAIVAMINDLFRGAPDGASLQFTADGMVVADDATRQPLALPVNRIVEHIAEIAVLLPEEAVMVWACFLHLIEKHYPYQTFFGHPIERTPDGVRLRRVSTPS